MVILGKQLPKDEFLVSFLVDARGGCLSSKRYPNLKIIVPPDAALSPTRIIFRFLRPESLATRPSLNDCNGFACRLIQIQCSCQRFQKPILLELPHIASLRNGQRELVVMRRNHDSSSWKEHTFSMDEAALQDNFGTFFNSLDSEEELQKKQIYRVATHDIPHYFSLVSVFKRNRAAIGPDGGLIKADTDERISVRFPPGALLKKMNINLEVQTVSRELLNHIVTKSNSQQVTSSTDTNIVFSPIVTVEPKRRKFRDLITIQLPVPLPNNPSTQKENHATELGQVRLLYSITEHDSVWEDITDSTQFSVSDGIMIHKSKISARVWLMYAPGFVATELANRLYALHHPTPYFGRIVLYTRPPSNSDDADSSLTQCNVRGLLITDDSSADKTLECKEGYQVVSTGPQIEFLTNSSYQIETAGNIIAVPSTTDEESVMLQEIEPFMDNRVTIPLRIRDTDERFEGKIAFVPLLPPERVTDDEDHPEDLTVKRKEVMRPICALDIYIPRKDDQPLRKLSDDVSSIPIVTNNDNEPIICPAYQIMRSELPLETVANQVGSDWVKLLPIIEKDAETQHILLDELIQSPKDDNSKCLRLLNHWVTANKDSNADGNQLQAALKMIGRDDVARACMANGEIQLVENEQEKQKAEKILRESGSVSPSSRHFDSPSLVIKTESVGSNDSHRDSTNLGTNNERESSICGPPGSMVVEIGDNESEIHRRRGFTSEIGEDEDQDDKSLVEEVLEPTLEELINVKKAARIPSDENSVTPQEKIDAFVRLTEEIEKDLPEPTFSEDDHQYDHDEALDETMFAEMNYSAVPDFLNINFEEEQDGDIIEQNYQQPVMSAVPDWVREDEDIEEPIMYKQQTEYETTPMLIDSRDDYSPMDTQQPLTHQTQPVYHEIYEPEPDVEKEIEEFEEELPDGRILKKKIVHTKTTKQILERKERELSPNEMGDLIDEDGNDPVVVDVYEEELEDGTKISRRVSTMVKSETKTLHQVVTDNTGDDVMVASETKTIQQDDNHDQEHGLIVDEVTEEMILQNETQPALKEEVQDPSLVTPTNPTPSKSSNQQFALFNQENTDQSEESLPQNDSSHDNFPDPSLSACSPYSSDTNDDNESLDTEAKDTSSYYSL